MKEMVSFHDDTEKRMGVFFGLGAFLISSLFALFQGLTPEGFLLRGVVVLFLFTLLGWGYGVLLKRTLVATAPKEELPTNMERRSRNAESLDDGGVLVMPGMGETEVMEEPSNTTGTVVNFTLPELSPMDSTFEGGLAPMIPSKNQAAAQAAVVAEPVDEGDLPPPAIPAWLK